MKVGFVINPIAGMGGAVGLGGSDDVSREELRRLGAVPIAQERAATALGMIKKQSSFGELSFITCGGMMGGDALATKGIECTIAYNSPTQTSARDTQAACKAFIAREVELILFVGGDGTARDVFLAVGKGVSILGIPSGVKMHSSVFVNTPEDMGRAVQDFFVGHRTIEAEIMDVDEKAFRSGRVSARLFGIAIIPDAADLVQPRKAPTDASTESDEIEEIVEYFTQNMDPRVLYVMGTGSTLASIERRLGIDKNELTVNAVLGGKEIGRDLAEKDILSLMAEHPEFKIVVTPIGGQGFVFGRGNQQMSAKVLRLTKNGDIMIVATPSKLSRIKSLRIDTGDSEIDARLRGHWKVMSGYGRFRAMPLQ